MDKTMSTKERIAYEALSLFSTRGYEAVSMRDIGGAVGIRESSLYKHYSGKQGILEAIVEMAREKIRQKYDTFHVPDIGEENAIDDFLQMDEEKLATMCTNMFLGLMEDEMVVQFWQLLTIEQYRNEELQKYLVELFINRPMQYQEMVFQLLLDRKVLKGESAKMMALQFFSPFFMLRYKLPGEKGLLVQTLREHTMSFIRSHLTEG